MAVVDVNKLGGRQVMKDTLVTVKDEYGFRHMKQVKKPVLETQPILTKEEAKVLDGEDWIATEGTAFADVARFYCIAADRRFFCDNPPVKGVPEKESEEIELSTKEKTAVTMGVKRIEAGEQVTEFQMAALNKAVQIGALDRFPEKKKEEEVDD